MSKKKPVKKTSTKKPAEQLTPVVPVKTSRPKADKPRPEFELIRFDRKTWIFILACVALFFMFTALKLHNSSIPWWNTFANDGKDPKRGLVAGEPLPIRSDEWLVNTCFNLSQHENGFPVSNDALGAGKTPLIMGLPTVHVLSMLRPFFWGYYLLDIERAFSWHWNFKIFPFLISMFLLLMLFTRNNFILSVFGSIWVLLSSAVQWWSISTELFTFGSLAVIAFIYILYSTKSHIIILGGILLIISAYTYAMNLYLPYQVPLAYFFIVLILGFLLKYREPLKLFWKKKLPLKLIVGFGVLVTLVGLLFLFYSETKETIEIMTNTVYPGKRSEKGGDFLFIKMFTDNFSPFIGSKSFPANWGNLCELSSFLMLSPIAAIILIADSIRQKRIDPLLISVVILQIILCIWLFVGFPAFLAKLTFFKASPSYRTFFIFGFINVVMTLLFLAHHQTTLFKKNVFTKIISFVILLILSFTINSLLNKQAASYFSTQQVWISTIIYAGLSWLMIHFREGKFYQAAFFIACFLFIAPNIKVNPVSQGLSPFYENEIFKAASEINKVDPDKGWAVFGKFQYANFFKAAGINCFNGVQFAPHIDKMHVIDPLMKADSVYNRYAHIAFSTWIDSKDSYEITLRQNDLYVIQMDPCSRRLADLGIKYIVFTAVPDPAEVRCMTLMVKDNAGFSIYKRNEL